MPRTGFEPVCLARKARMIGRATLSGQDVIIGEIILFINVFVLEVKKCKKKKKKD